MTESLENASPYPDGYWVVTFRAFAFNTEAEARVFETNLLDAFVDMKGNDDVAASTIVRRETLETIIVHMGEKS